MSHANKPLVQSPIFTLRTLPLDLLALGSLSVVILIFIPILQSFTQQKESVAADSMTFSILSLLCLLYARILIGMLSIVKGTHANRILGIACIIFMFSTIVPHLFRQPLLIAWAHHCGYEVDHVIHNYRDTKLVFRKIGEPGGALRSDGKIPNM